MSVGIRQLWRMGVCLLSAAAVGYPAITLAFARENAGRGPEPGLVPSGLHGRARLMPFTPTVVLPGEIMSTRTDDVISHYQYRTNIKWLAPEGITISEGDLAAVVMAYRLESMARWRTYWFKSSEARHKVVQQTMEPNEMDRQHDERLAETRLRGAELRLRQLERGPDPEEVQLARIVVEKAQLKFDWARKTVQRLQRLGEGTGVSREHLEGADYECELAESELRMAEAAWRTLKSGASELELLEARSQVASARSALEAVKRASAATREQDAADLARAHEELKQAEIDLRTYVGWINSTKRRANMSGIVLWPPIYLGGKSRPGLVHVWTAPIVTIIDPEAVVFMARATEEQVAGLAVGQSAVVELRAFPDRALSGRIAAIAVTSQDLSLKYRFGEREQRKETGVRVYDVVVEIDPKVETALFQGMSGRATVKLMEPDEKVVIPQACIRRSGGGCWALVWRSNGWQVCELTVASEDENYVAVASGLSPGDKAAILAE